MKSKKIAFIVSKFPCYDEAFILREVYAMSHSLDIVIFSLKKSQEKVVHDQARELLPKTVYTPYLFSWKIAAAHLERMVTSPFQYVKTLLRLIFGNLKSPEFFIKNMAFFPKAVYLAKLMREKGIEHIHAYWATYPASVAMVVSEITGIPFSFMGHAHDIYLDTTYLKEKIAKASFISTCTMENKKYLEKLSPFSDPEKILLQYHGLTLNDFQSAVKSRSGSFQILSVGTLHPHKGFNHLIDGLAILKSKGLSFHCTIVGSGPLEYDLRKHIRLLHLEGEVTMTGALKQSEVIPYYKRSDILVLMAQAEWHWGIPNVLIEALAAKTAVVTTRFGSVHELIQDGETGLLVPAKDSKALALAMERLYLDENLRTDLAQKGHERVLEMFNLEKNIKLFTDRVKPHVIASDRRERSNLVFPPQKLADPSRILSEKADCFVAKNAPRNDGSERF